MGRPKLIGVTGGIGSGKTTVCKILEILGAKTYYADDRAKEMMETDASIITSVAKVFGKEAYLDGQLNRKEIARQAFKNKELLEQLNQIVHPKVKRDFENWVSDNSSEWILVKEAALLIEAGSHKELDCIILVMADEEERIRRVLARDSHRSEEDVKKIISKQLTDDQKSSLADFVIDNTGNNSLIKQVTSIYNQL